MGLGLGLGVYSSPYTGGFSIKEISGLQAWYKFNTLHTLDGNDLEEWGDSSGNNRTLTNTIATNKRPTVEASGRVDWGDVSSSFMNISNGPIPNSSAYTVIVVVEHPVAQVNRISRYLNDPSSGVIQDTISWGTSSFNTNQTWQAVINGFGDTTTRVSLTSATGKLVNNQKTIISYRYGGGTTAGDTTFKVETVADGGSLTTAKSVVNLTNTSDAVLNGTTVGFNSTTQFIDGYMDEMCVWNRDIDGTELTKVIADSKARHNMT